MFIACGSARGLRSDADRHGRHDQHHEIHLLKKSNVCIWIFALRTGINADGADTTGDDGAGLPAQDRKAVDAADYQMVTAAPGRYAVLKDDVLASKELLVMPDGSVTPQYAHG